MLALKVSSSAASFWRRKQQQPPSCKWPAPARRIVPLAHYTNNRHPPSIKYPANNNRYKDNNNNNSIRKKRDSVAWAPPPSPPPLLLGFASSERFSLFVSSRCLSSSSAATPPSGPDPLPRGSGGLDDMEKRHSKFLTLPTVLTLGRVAAVPLLIATFYVDSWWGRTATTSIFIAAAVTDWLDGYLARKMSLGTAFGAFLDPVADKLMVGATLVLLCTQPFEVPMFGYVPWLLTIPSIAIIGREITMSAVREWAASQDGRLLEAVAVNNLGKWKTATQMIALTILLATRESSLGAPGALVASGVVLLYISAGLSVWSLTVYMSKIWRVLSK